MGLATAATTICMIGDMMPRRTNQTELDRVKKVVLGCIAAGRSRQDTGHAKCLIGGKSLHIRYRAKSEDTPDLYIFNINPNTLTSDYELWICGSEDRYYLIPIGAIRSMYGHPAAYPDRRHPSIRIVTVDVVFHRVMFAAGAVGNDIERYFCTTLPV